jgi:hypothetical protein
LDCTVCCVGVSGPLGRRRASLAVHQAVRAANPFSTLETVSPPMPHRGLHGAAAPVCSEA